MSNTLKMVYEKLNSLGIPVAYGHFDSSEDVHVPFIIYRSNRKIISADSDCYFYSNEFNIELYYKGVDIGLEEQFRKVLHEVKSVIDYEQASLEDVLLLRATFNLIEDKEKENE